MFQRKLSITLVAMLIAIVSHAQPPAGNGYVLLSSTIDNGGGTSTGGDFVLQGTAGQPDAHVPAATGGEFVLSGGFWARITEISELIFKDGFETLTPNP